MSTENKSQSVDSLQATINKKAEQKLRKDLWGLYNSLKGNRLLVKFSGNSVPELGILKGSAEIEEVRSITGVNNEAIGSKFKALKATDIEVKDLPNVAYMYSESCSMEKGNGSSSDYIKELFNYWLPFYIKEETDLFLERINKIEEDVEYLSGSVAGLEHNQCNHH